jgi:hypothetical protein
LLATGTSSIPVASLVAVGLTLLVQLEALLGLRHLLLVLEPQVDDLLLPLDGFLEVTALGMRGGEGGEAASVKSLTALSSSLLRA